NEIRAAKIARVANPLALVAQQQQSHHPHTHLIISIRTPQQEHINLQPGKEKNRANQDNSPRIHRNAGYDGQRSGIVAGAKDTIGSLMVQKSGIQCYNCKEYGHIARE
nr:hypothetical protein [Tanacetum cinerariifolium]